MKNMRLLFSVLFVCALTSCKKQYKQLPLEKRFYNARMSVKFEYYNTLFGQALTKELKKHTPNSLKNEKGYLYYVHFREHQHGGNFFICWLADKSDVNGIEIYSETTKQAKLFMFTPIMKKIIKEEQNKVSIACGILLETSKKNEVPAIFKSGNCKARLIGNNLKPLGRWIPVTFYTKEEYKKIIDKLITRPVQKLKDKE